MWSYNFQCSAISGLKHCESGNMYDRTTQNIVKKNDKPISIIPAERSNFVYFDLDINCKVGVLAK